MPFQFYVPDTSNDCTFCESDVEAHNPVFVETKTDGEREQAGQFCNYACLSAWIDAEDKVVGNTCQFDPA